MGWPFGKKQSNIISLPHVYRVVPRTVIGDGDKDDRQEWIVEKQHANDGRWMDISKAFNRKHEALRNMGLLYQNDYVKQISAAEKIMAGLDK